MDYSFSSSPAPAGTALQAVASAPTTNNLGAILDRIAEAVDAETSGIRADPRFDLKASNARKSRCLYELSRATRNIREADLVAEHREALRSLSETLKRNERIVRAHLDAVGEVASLLQGVIERAQSDGTYGANGSYGGAYGGGF